MRIVRRKPNVPLPNAERRYLPLSLSSFMIFPLLQLPPEIHESILDWVVIRADLWACSLASKYLQTVAEQKLYRSIDLSALGVVKRVASQSTENPSRQIVISEIFYTVDAFRRRSFAKKRAASLFATLSANPNKSRLVEVLIVNESPYPALTRDRLVSAFRGMSRLKHLKLSVASIADIWFGELSEPASSFIYPFKLESFSLKVYTSGEHELPGLSSFLSHQDAIKALNLCCAWLPEPQRKDLPCLERLGVHAHGLQSYFTLGRVTALDIVPRYVHPPNTPTVSLVGLRGFLNRLLALQLPTQALYLLPEMSPHLIALNRLTLYLDHMITVGWKDF